LHVNGRFPDLALRACQRGRAMGITISLNIGRGDVAHGVDGLIPLADLIVASGDWCQRRGLRAAEACATLLDAGARMASVTYGERGSYVASPSQRAVHVPALEAPVVRTAGAGDTYHAAFLSAFLSGAPAQECARRGARAAAAHCVQEGGFRALADAVARSSGPPDS
jgi:sugar/nucleoside kinase (ribokinase family)